ncbi:dnaJ homolog subfamily C member 17-like [Ruditapes philippinarum]|uniref:dnaJ homolog subfamily C member 17-like n=1 Tax=Ruditapes philippinarum TaxID=129788 RepID=UPI00295B9689|nr:dnaJ homolog subfamily C member 17-like [Ruditapes philippinarum]
MSKKLDITKEDLYGILDVDETATEKEITKSYRKQALKCHPDKNPDNPKAAELFHKLTQALDILTDAAAKAAYDKILKAKKAALLRQKHYDSKRKKFKEDLEARERAAGEQKVDSAADARKLQAEIERLRKDGNRILQETQEQLRKDLEEKLNKAADDGDDDDDDCSTVKIKAKWKIRKGENRDEGYTKQELEDIFSKYGEVLNLVVSVKKSGTAIVEYSSPYTADLAVRNVKGKEDFPLTLSWLSGQPPEERLGNHNNEATDGGQKFASNTSVPTFSTPSQPYQFNGPASSDNKDFESVVLMKMRQAEERKRLIEQMEKEDEENG